MNNVDPKNGQNPPTPPDLLRIRQCRWHQRCESKTEPNPNRFRNRQSRINPPAKPTEDHLIDCRGACHFQTSESIHNIASLNKGSG